MDGVAEGIEDRGDLLVDPRPVVPDVRHRQDDVLGERPVATHAEADRIRAEVPATGPAVAAAAADDMALAAHDVAGVEVGHVAADLDDLAHELVADDEGRDDRLRGPRIPRLDVEVGPADAGLADANQDVVDAWVRLRDVLELEAGSRCSLHQGPHQPRVVPRRHRRRTSRRRVLDAADPLDLAAHPVARLQEDRRRPEDADAGRRARGDDVARLQGDRAADELDELRHAAIMSAVEPSCMRTGTPAPSPAQGFASSGAGGRPPDPTHRA